MNLYHSTYLYIILILVLFSCKSESNITVYKIKKNSPPPSLNWTPLKSWIKKAPTEFSLASYDVPTSNGELIDLSITTFPGDAGGVTQNVNRWRRQINLEPQSEKIILV